MTGVCMDSYRSVLENRQAIYSGVVNISGSHGVCVIIGDPPTEGSSTEGSYPLATCLPLGQQVWPFGNGNSASFEWTGLIVNGYAEILQNQAYNNNCGGCDWFWTGFLVFADITSEW